MGVTLGQAVLYLMGDRTHVDKSLDDTERDAKSWATNLGSNVNKLVGGALLAGGTAVVAGVAAVGTVAVGVANDVAVAQGRIQSQLNLTDQQANLFGETIKRVYGNNFGESIEDVGTALATTAQELGRVGVTAQEELGLATEHAIALRDAFEVDVGQSTNAAAALMDHLGLSSQQAFDFIASGLQDSRISNEDFVETISEYSNLFGDAGFTADQFYSIMATGSEAGVLGTDKVADAIKEFGIIMNEENADAAQAIRDLGLDYDDMVDQVATGSATWADFFGDIVGGLQGIEDPMVRAQMQTAIFGTMAEDLGVNFTDSLSDTAVTMDEISGATEGLNAQYNNLGSFVGGFKRRVQVGLEPMGRIVLDIAQRAMPFLERGIERVIGLVDRIGRIASMAFGEFFLVLEEGGSPLDAFLALLDQLLFDLGLSDEEIGAIKDTILELAGIVQNALAVAMGFFTEHSEELKAALLAIGAALAAAGIVAMVGAIVAAIGTLLSPIGLIVAAIGVLAAAWAGNWGGIRDKVTAVINFIRPFLENAIQAIRLFWQQNGDQILANVRLAWDTIRSVIAQVMERVKTRIDQVLKFIQTIYKAFSAAFAGDWTTFGATLREAWDQVWNHIRERFNSARTQLVNIARNVATSVKERFTSINWGEVGRQIINGIANAITAGAGAIADAARRAAEAALAAAKAFLGIESPSKVAGEEVGDPFVVGIAKRIEAGAKTLKDAAVFALGGALSGASSRAVSATAGARAQGARLVGAGAGSITNYFQFDIRISGATPGTTIEKIRAVIREEMQKIGARATNRRSF